jgi:hypothetical protein
MSTTNPLALLAAEIRTIGAPVLSEKAAGPTAASASLAKDGATIPPGLCGSSAIGQTSSLFFRRRTVLPFSLSGEPDTLKIAPRR